MTAHTEARHALIVATARYRDPKLQQLRAPAADARRLAGVLRDPAKGNFDVEVLIDEAQATTTRRIARFFQERHPHDLLLLHFSCHGVKDERGELFLAAADTELDLLSATGVSAAWLNDQISRTRSRRTVVLLDCCFSGSFPFGMVARGDGIDAPEQLQGRGRAIITASSAMEYAYEGDELRGEGQPSVFTEAVVEGLDSGKADLDEDQLVSIDDLYGYVYARVKDRTPNQTPSKKSDLQGPLYLARSAYRPPVQPATLDPELLARTDDRYAGIRAGAVSELADLLSARDPSVALAARNALEAMLDDDSRRVGAGAEAALDAADRAEAQRAERERIEIERAAAARVTREPQLDQPQPDDDIAADVDADVDTRDADRTAGASDRPPASQLHEPGHASARPPKPGPAAKRIRRLQQPLVAIVLAVLATATAAVFLNTAPTPQKPPDTLQTLRGAIPASINKGCKPARDRWMIKVRHATQQVQCLADGALAYGLWPNTGAAAAAMSGLRTGDEGCPRIDKQLKNWPGTDARCKVETNGYRSTRFIIWWRSKKPGGAASRVIGWYEFANDGLYGPTDNEAQKRALGAWKQIQRGRIPT